MVHSLPRRRYVLVWKCLHDVAPRYLVDLCVPTAATAGRRQSRSVVSGALRTSIGQRSFAVYGPEPGTNYGQPFNCQNCRYLHSSASSRPTSSSTSVLVVAVSRIYRRSAVGAVATVVSSAPIINVPTRLISTDCSSNLML